MYISVLVLFRVTECYSYRLWVPSHWLLYWRKHVQPYKRYSTYLHAQAGCVWGKLGTFCAPFPDGSPGKRAMGAFDGSILCLVSSPPVQSSLMPISLISLLLPSLKKLLILLALYLLNNFLTLHLLLSPMSR